MSSITSRVSNVDEITAGIENMKMGLSGHNLPRDIATNLTDAVACSDKFPFVSEIPSALTKPYKKLLGCLSLLRTLPMWNVSTKDLNITLVAKLMSETQSYLVEQTIDAIQEFFFIAYLLSQSPKEGQFIGQLIALVELSLHQLLAVKMSNNTHLDVEGQELLLGELLINLAALSKRYNESSKQHTTNTLRLAINVSEDLILQPVYFLFHVMQIERKGDGNYDFVTLTVQELFETLEDDSSSMSDGGSSLGSGDDEIEESQIDQN